MMKFKLPKLEEEYNRDPFCVEVWYSKDYDSWLTQLKDINNNQIGEIDYSNTKKEAMNFAKTLQLEYKVKIKVFKQDGEFQKEIHLH